MDECKPLPVTNPPGSTSTSAASRHIGSMQYPMIRGLHLSNFQLNVSAFCHTGGAFRECLRGV